MKTTMNILGLRAKAVFICLHFNMNKTSVIAALLLALECQLNLTEDKDPIFSPKGRTHFVWTS